MVGHGIKSKTGESIDLGAFLMSWVMVGHGIKSKTGESIDLGAFLMSWVMVGHGIESEVGRLFLHIPTLLLIL